jgi:hypothetical protein
MRISLVDKKLNLQFDDSLDVWALLEEFVVRAKIEGWDDREISQVVNEATHGDSEHALSVLSNYIYD